MSKPKLRARQAALSFTEKIKILERLRDRERAIAASGLRGKSERHAENKAAKETGPQLPRVFVDFHNSDPEGRVRLNCVGTVEDLDRLGIVLREGTEMLLSCLECEGEGIATYSTEEGLWVAKVDRNKIRYLPGNES